MRPVRRRVAAAALGLLGLAFAALPAAAHNQASVHSVSWVDQDPNDSPGDPDGKVEKLYGIDFVAAKAQFDDDIARWRVEMRPEAGGEPAFCDRSGPFDNTLSFRCNWDTTRTGDMTDLDHDQAVGGGPIAPNGRYVITVTVWNVGRPQGILSSALAPEAHVLTPTRTVILQNPVSAPAGVNRSYDSNTGKVTVTWAASPEPDVQKYIIQEKKGSGGWENIGERPNGVTSFDRQLSDVGTYQYRVAAVRPEVAQSGFSEAPALEVAAPPPPPGSVPEGPAPGPEPGVTVLEAPTTSTTVQAGAVAPGGARPPAGGSGLFARPSAGSLPRPAAPKTTPTTVDTGYSPELPYDTSPKTQNGVLEDPEDLAGAEQPQSMTRLITVPNPRDPRSLLVPLAGGLTIFVFAMQMTYVVRRRPALVQMDDDFGDWTGL
jgi:hypothetical protein